MSAVERIVLTVPAPCAWIDANDRGMHWAKKAKLTRQWRDATCWAARAARLPAFTTRVHITATIHKVHGRTYDAANWAPTAKAAVDGLRDAGVLLEDDNRHVIGPDMRQGHRAPDGAFLRLVIAPAEEVQP